MGITHSRAIAGLRQKAFKNQFKLSNISSHSIHNPGTGVLDIGDLVLLQLKNQDPYHHGTEGSFDLG